MSYAFTLDASACTGCKACQEACKDKNNLPVGLLWRRVIEVSGGEWQAKGDAWENTVFAYNLSIACNHCTHPKCAGVCPTDAYIVRPDGIVLIDETKCMGCGYCSWACPYGAPQYDQRRGVMTKCNFCYDNIDLDLPPTCVSACPLRVLDYTKLEEVGTNTGELRLWQRPGTEHPFPLPEYSRTEPHLALKLHKAMRSPLDKAVANREEILPPGSADYEQGLAGRRELPLVSFTLLAQLAAGMAMCGLAISPLPMPMLLAIGVLLGLGGLSSFLHLGNKRNAWRSIMHLQKSWLSREVLLAGLFAISWLGTLLLEWLRGSPVSPWPMALLAMGLVYSMASVYRLRAAPGWNSWRTYASFFLSAIILGALQVNLASSRIEWVIVAGLGLLAELVITLTMPNKLGKMASRLRIVLLALGSVSALVMGILMPGLWLSIPVFLIALAAEIIGRWQFYAGRVPFPFISK